MLNNQENANFSIFEVKIFFLSTYIDVKLPVTIFLVILLQKLRY